MEQDCVIRLYVLFLASINNLRTSYWHILLSFTFLQSSGDEGGLQSVVPVLAQAGLGWCGPSLAGWPAPGQPSWLSVLPGPPQSAHHTQIERHSSDQWQWLQLQRSFRGGYSGDRTCKWYKPSLSRVDTMSNRLTRLIIMSVVCSVVSYPIIFHIDTIKSLTVKKDNPIFDK